MTDVSEVLRKLSEQNASILQQLQELSINRQPPNRQESAESDSNTRGDHGDHDNTDQQGAGAVAPSPTLGTAGNIQVQEEYQAIKDSVQNIKLAADLKVSDSRQGVKREDTPHANVIGKCAKFAETSMKLLIQADKKPLTAAANEEFLYKLYAVQLAQIRYLQEEHASIIVQGQFDKDTARLFRALQRNTAEFPPTAVATLQHAAAISAARQQYQPRRPFRGRGSSYFRGRGGRGRDSYSQFVRRDVDHSAFPRGDQDTEH
jgi:hypothetical protein